jgi:hypothetical protein
MPRLVRPLHHEGFSKGRQQPKVKAKSLLCFWAIRELGMLLIDLAREFQMSIPGVGYAVVKGETIVQDNKYQLIAEIYFNFLRASPFSNSWIRDRYETMR